MLIWDFHPGNLSHLHLSGNNLRLHEFFSQFYFPPIVHLELDRNEARSLWSDGDHSRKSSLRSLSLNQNGFRSLCCQGVCHLTLAGLTNLQYFSARDNKIETIDSGAFSGCSTKLKYLKLSGNRLSQLDKVVFTGLSRLEQLELQDNYLGQMPNVCGLGQLRAVRLDGNKIKRLDDRCFCGLREILFINLSSNFIEFVASESFAGLTKLEELNLSENRLRQMTLGWARELTSIIHIDLSGNRFNDTREFHVDERNVKLQRLVARGNSLSSLQLAHFTQMPNLTIYF